MTENNKAIKYIALPVQLIDDEEGVIIRRGVFQLKLDGADVKDVMNIIVSNTSFKAMLKSEIQEFFMDHLQAQVGKLIDLLIEKNILINKENAEENIGITGEKPIDIFHWNFNSSTKVVLNNLKNTNFVIIGVNEISKSLVESMQEAGIKKLTVVDDPLARNTSLFDNDKLSEEKWQNTLPEPVNYESWGNDIEPASIDCMVVTSEHGGQDFVREWNEQCVEENVPCFPVVLKDLIGYIGPYVIPGESACFECFRGRQNAHLDNPSMTRKIEKYAFEGQAVNGYHPIMPSIIGKYTAYELLKIYGKSYGNYEIGTLIRVNMNLPQTTTHKVLKLPRCPVCSNLAINGNESTLKSTFMPGHKQE